ncbi:MAG: hypothetical protein CMO80_12440 [Verrucomicrobiales bacterium]|nr:hypothetical protein [Verrucomicrobiales bacterium]
MSEKRDTIWPHLLLLTLLLPAGGRCEEPSIDWDRAREFWAFKAPVAAQLPMIKQSGWTQTRLDHFILAKLEERGLKPSGKAPTRRLVRRLFFDLTGLPPTRDDMDRFSGTTDVSELVDDLLNRRGFGERMASLWLNITRYAEDQAHQVGSNTALAYPNAYKYRAWVIDAFNRDLPYDEFIRRQLAVDLMDSDNEDHLAALGYMGLGHKYYSRGNPAVMAEEWAEKVDTVTRSLLGLTVACAQCHDHKYDPVTTKDYYGLAGVFANLKMVNKSADGVYEKKNTTADKMSPATMHLVEDVENAKDLNVFLRGNVKAKGPIVPRGFLQILSAGERRKFTKGSGRRELADAIATAGNPLTARVFVNRVWAMLFGRGIVGTTSNFGKLGDRPTHPELLDDLAVRFMKNGWSTKWLIRELVHSATYQQSSKLESDNAAIDEANQFLWRMNKRRLSVEQFRDAVLVASGELDPDGGKSLELDDEKNLRRTVYARISRLSLNKTLMLFDYPDANIHASRRFDSTTAPQKLFAMNNPFMLERAKAFAARLEQAGDGNSDRVEAAYQIAFARPPNEAEQAVGWKFLSLEPDAKMTALERYAHAVLAANEMIYID